MWFSCFRVLPGSAAAQVIWGGIVKHLLIAYFIGNISAIKYQNPFMCVKVIGSQRWDVCLRHGVLPYSRGLKSAILTSTGQICRRPLSARGAAQRRFSLSINLVTRLTGNVHDAAEMSIVWSQRGVAHVQRHALDFCVHRHVSVVGVNLLHFAWGVAEAKFIMVIIIIIIII